MTHPFSFNEIQFNRLFPFYILINRDLQVIAMGNSIRKLLGITDNYSFNTFFAIPRPLTPINNFDDLVVLQNQMVVLESSTVNKILFRGQFEYLKETEEILFVGSPWFGSMEQVTENKLIIDDFARHDPLIDLLHVLKSQEITNEDLKQLISTINKQKNDLRKANQEIHDIALFPTQNPDPIIRINFNGDVLRNNPAASRLDFFEFENQTYRNDEFFKIVSTRIDKTNPRWIIEAGSNNREYSFVCVSMNEEEYVNIYGRDITQQKEDQQEIQRLSLVASANENGVLFTTPDGYITWANEGFCKLTGYSLNEIIGKSPIELCKGPLSDEESIYKLLESFFKGQGFNTEVIYYRKDKSWFWGRSVTQPIKNKDGKITEFFGIIQDVTEEKVSEEKLKVLSQIAENNISGVIIADREGKITWVNKSYIELTGYTLEESFGKKPGQLLQGPDTDKDTVEYLRNQIAKGQPFNADIINYSKNGTKYWLRLQGQPINNEKGELTGFFALGEDITKEKEMELELIQAKNTAEESTKVKEAFLANMSHEIRTPMNAIMGMGNQLAKTKLTDQQDFYIKTINTAAENLLVIINDILDLSKIEAGKLNVEKIGFEPKKVVVNAMKVLMHKAEEKGLILSNSFYDNRLSTVLIGDPYRLTQVLLNLISNAIKFTEDGSVDITCELINETAAIQTVQVKVIDTGIGMSKDFAEKLFEKFSQEYESVSRRYGGSGLGMSICKELIELMGGEIEVSSSKGKGTTVLFRIEFKKGTTADIANNISENITSGFLAGKTIMVTDDNDMNRLVASTILENYGATIIEAANGEEALYALDKNKTDLVLMDIQMPVLDGYEAVKIIRKRGNKIPVIALTANAIKGENEKCIEAGMNDYIAKPFKEEEFLKKIAHWLNTETSTTQVVEFEKTSDDALLYDLSGLQEISRGNQSFISKMVNLFCEQSPVMVKQIKEAYATDKLDIMGAVAHKLKPSIDNLKIYSLKQIIRNIEKAGKEQNISEELASQIQLTEEVISKTINKLKQEFPV